MELLKIRDILSHGSDITELKLRVCVYARVSTDHIEQQQSLINQVEYFKEYILSNKNWKYVGAYIDNGISGTNDIKRENFMKMIFDAKEDKFDLIITKEISRFSRNTFDSIKYTRLLLSYGVAVYFVSDNINTIFYDSEFRLTIMASMAQDEVRRISERVKFGMRRAIERGKILGNDLLYGYKKNRLTGNLEIIDSEAEIIRMIFCLYVYKKYSLGKIAIYLNKSFNSRKWYSSTISRILTNPKYKGFYCGGKVRTIDYITKQKEYVAQNEWIVYKDFQKIPPIIEEVIWEEANKRFLARKKNIEKRSVDSCSFVFSNKIFCERDNSVYYRRMLKRDVAFYCNHFLMYGRNCCNSVMVRESELKKIFFSLFSFFNIDHNLVFNYLDSLYNNYNSVSEKLYTLLNKKKNLIIKKEKLITLNIEGILSISDLKNKFIDIDSNICDINSEIKKLFAFETYETFSSDTSFFNLFYDYAISMVLEKIIVLKKSYINNIYLTIYINYDFFPMCKKYIFKRGYDVKYTKKYDVCYYVEFIKYG